MIICIGREFGSGGYEIGKRLASSFDIPCYDRELIEHVMERSSVDAGKLEKADEKKANPWIHSVYYESENKDLRGLSANDIVFRMQSEVIVELAKKGDCIFIGRCADEILHRAGIERLSIFVTAPFEDRVKRKSRLLNIDEKSAASLVRKSDKHRRAYYDYYAEKSWGKPHNYDICINSSTLGIYRTEKMLEVVLKLPSNDVIWGNRS
ncbi:MAG: cytidylate kinase-like family protein [Lachnospiraceae bacterium]|nr:cytidylate kinase-like family protein [Lachnospiraceae bacterium]